MKITIVMTVLITVFIGGCGDGYYWYKKGATLKQAEAACRECYREAMSQRMAELHDGRRESHATHATYIPETENSFENEFQSITFNNCMKARGYREVSGEYLDPSLRKKYCCPSSESIFNIAGE